MLPKAILFDLDDTIISFDGVCEAAWEKVCKDFSTKTSFLSDVELLRSIAKVRKWYWNDPIRHQSGRLNLVSSRREIVRIALYKHKIPDEKYVLEIADGYTKLQEEMIHLFPNAIQTLEYLYKKGVKLAMLTNGSAETQRRKIERFKLAEYFETILIEGEQGFGKPDPRVYELALEKLQVNQSETWMIGDNLEWDVAAPQRLGIYSIWNDFNNVGLPQSSTIKPDRIVTNISELLEEEGELLGKKQL
jgi:putative hydrolase of the HAD superfamily